MQITIEKKEYPDAGAKTGSVKAGGRYFKAWPDKLDMMEEGLTYEVEVEESEWQGKTQYWIKKKPRMVVGNVPPSDRPVGSNVPLPAPPRPAVRTDEDHITRVALVKSLIEAGMLKDGMSMDDIVEMAWVTAPKIRNYGK
jgi:hypothetical protein